jgi:phosphatidylglycerophosphatase A
MTLSRLVASGFCSGFVPVAPGTAGSVVGIILGAGLLHVSPGALLVGTVVATGGGVFATMRATGMPLRVQNKTVADDPGWVVIDEIAGQCCALLLLPRPSWAGAALAFAAFRALDIGKPGPIGWADRQPGAAGIMADDILAGLAAAVIVGGAHILWPGWV